MASSPCKTVGGSFKAEGARVKEGASGGCLGRLTCLGALRLLCLLAPILPLRRHRSCAVTVLLQPEAEAANTFP